MKSYVLTATITQSQEAVPAIITNICVLLEASKHKWENDFASIIYWFDMTLFNFMDI